MSDPSCKKNRDGSMHRIGGIKQKCRAMKVIPDMVECHYYHYQSFEQVKGSYSVFNIRI